MMYKVPPKKSIETIKEELSHIAVRPGDVYKYSDGTLYSVASVSYGAGSVRGNYFVTFTKVEENVEQFHFRFHDPIVFFTKEMNEFLESNTMYSGQNSQYDEYANSALS